jgi:hypothetical protein
VLPDVLDQQPAMARRRGTTPTAAPSITSVGTGIVSSRAQYTRVQVNFNVLVSLPGPAVSFPVPFNC